MTALARQQRRKYFNALAYSKRKEARDTKKPEKPAWNIKDWDENNAKVREMLSDQPL